MKDRQTEINSFWEPKFTTKTKHMKNIILSYAYRERERQWMDSTKYEYSTAEMARCVHSIHVHVLRQTLYIGRYWSVMCADMTICPSRKLTHMHTGSEWTEINNFWEPKFTVKTSMAYYSTCILYECTLIHREKEREREGERGRERGRERIVLATCKKHMAVSVCKQILCANITAAITLTCW